MGIIEVKDVCKVFGSKENSNTVLDNVSLNIEKGEFVSLMGESGSGKSTLLYLIGGLDKPTSGNIFIDGKDINAIKEKELAVLRRKDIGFVFQFYNLVQNLTVEENIMLPVIMDGRKEKDYKERLEEILDIVGLKEKRKSLPNQLSGGQQQRVSIARALALQPKILFFDEPTSALDPELTGEVLKVIKELAKEHMTMIIVTHEMQFAKEVSDRIIFMEGGVIVEQGTPDQIFASKNIRVQEFIGKIAR